MTLGGLHKEGHENESRKREYPQASMRTVAQVKLAKEQERPTLNSSRTSSSTSVEKKEGQKDKRFELLEFRIGYLPG